MGYEESRFKSVKSTGLGRMTFTTSGQPSGLTSLGCTLYWPAPADCTVTEIVGIVDVAFTTKLAASGSTAGAYATVSKNGTAIGYLANTAKAAATRFVAALADTTFAQGDVLKVALTEPDTSGKAQVFVEWKETYHI